MEIFFLTFVTGLFFIFSSKSVHAEEYTPVSESNAEALRILEEYGALENCRFPLENITYEKPVLIPLRRATYRRYKIDERKIVYGIDQVKCLATAPVGFTWYENGIPVKALAIYGSYFYFSPDIIRASGARVKDNGRYWSYFTIDNTNWGFWATASNVNDLILS